MLCAKFDRILLATVQCFIQTPKHGGGEWRLLEEAAEWGPKGRKSRPKAESGGEVLGREGAVSPLPTS